MYAMRDVFGRFGNLIDVYMLSGKICGYAKYASKESAEQAIQVSTIFRQHGHKLLATWFTHQQMHCLLTWLKV